MATVLALVQSAMYELGVPAPSSIVGTDSVGLQLKNLLYAECRFLRSQRIFPQTKKKYTFTLTASRTKYPLPEDFFASLPDTQWDATNRWPLNGPMSDGEFNYRLYGTVSVQNLRAYRIFGPDINPTTGGGQFQIDPSPTATDSLTYEYVSKNMFLPKNWSASTAFGASSYCNANGNIYSTTAGGTTGSTEPSHTTGSASDGSVTWVYVSAAYETIVLDTDLCIFDDDVVIQGLKYRYRVAKGEDPSVEMAEHERLLGVSKARYFGSFRVSMAQDELRVWSPNIDDESWSIT